MNDSYFRNGVPKTLHNISFFGNTNATTIGNILPLSFVIVTTGLSISSRIPLRDQ